MANKRIRFLLKIFFAALVSKGADRQPGINIYLFLVGDLREPKRRKFVSYFNIEGTSVGMDGVS